MKKFTKEHEWIATEGEIGTVGISDYAQKQLGDVVYIALTKQINEKIKVGDDVAEIESVKSVSQIYSPVEGELIEFNALLEDESNSGLINQDPYGKGWIFKIKILNKSQLDSLMDQAQYEEYTKSI